MPAALLQRSSLGALLVAEKASSNKAAATIKRHQYPQQQQSHVNPAAAAIAVVLDGARAAMECCSCLYRHQQEPWEQSAHCSCAGSCLLPSELSSLLPAVAERVHRRCRDSPCFSWLWAQPSFFIQYWVILAGWWG